MGVGRVRALGEIMKPQCIEFLTGLAHCSTCYIHDPISSSHQQASLNGFISNMRKLNRECEQPAPRHTEFRSLSQDSSWALLTSMPQLFPSLLRYSFSYDTSVAFSCPPKSFLTTAPLLRSCTGFCMETLHLSQALGLTKSESKEN